MPLSRLDKFYRSILLSKYFVKGWGNPEALKRLLEFRKIVANRDACSQLVPRSYPVNITKELTSSDLHIIEGYFISPFEIYMPGLLPTEAKKANFQMILPTKWSSDHYKPVCLHMAGTGDHYFWRRRHIMAKPLLREAGIGSIILENPFYGTRKPIEQVRSVLHNVSDIFVMGGCLILEALVLFNWCLREGLGPLGITGMSMGGHMASLAATNWPYPIVLVPCLSWSTASSVFTEGVMSNAINWRMLESQIKEDKTFTSEIQKMVQVIGGDAFKAGQQFVKSFPESMTSFANTVYEESKARMLSRNISSKIENSNLINSEKDSPILNDDSDDQRLIQSTKDSKQTAAFVNFSLSDLMKIKLLNLESQKAILHSLNEKLLRAAKHEPMNWRQHEAFHFMRGIMDECTHLRNFSVPVDTSLIIAVCALDDGYVPREGVMDLTDIWKGAEVQYLDAGHVSAFLLHRKVFRNAIAEGFERYKRKYLNNKS